MCRTWSGAVFMLPHAPFPVCRARNASMDVHHRQAQAHRLPASFQPQEFRAGQDVDADVEFIMEVMEDNAPSVKELHESINNAR